MTTIDFYTHAAQPLEVAAKLIAKAWVQHGAVRVLTPDARATDALDRLLWVQPATGFLPHCRLASPLANETPVLIDHALDHDGPATVLVNLHSEPPPFFSRFDRLVEIVGRDEDQAAPARARWKFYKERGYELRSHNLSERG